MEIQEIIISDNAFNHSDPRQVILSNISVINLLREEGVDEELLFEDGLISYLVDYYFSQVSEGGFSQFVWNSKWSEDINEMIVEGLTQLQAVEHLAYFEKQQRRMKALSAIKKKKFFELPFSDKNPIKTTIDDNSFTAIAEDLIQLHSDWIKNHPQLTVLPIADMFEKLETIVGHSISR
ncbi:DMP19 family protein [Flavobacterium sp. JP2137]|uniref:DMP19 family protein n=1 Tax=Flavobacterium sp. JP2137 TaxID=3414510 RepID=UPI003D2FBDB0